MLVPHGFCLLNLYVLLVKSGLIGEIQTVGETYIFIGWLPRFRWLNRIPIFMSDLQLYRHENCSLHRLPKSCRSDICTVKTAGNKRRMPWKNQQSDNPTIRNWKNSDPTRLDISTTGVPSSTPSPRVHQSTVESSTDALNHELGISGTKDWGFSLEFIYKITGTQESWRIYIYITLYNLKQLVKMGWNQHTWGFNMDLKNKNRGFSSWIGIWVTRNGVSLAKSGCLTSRNGKPGIQSTRMDILPHMRISTEKEKNLRDQAIFAFKSTWG